MHGVFMRIGGEGECGRAVVSKCLVGGVPDTGNGDGEGKLRMAG